MSGTVPTITPGSIAGMSGLVERPVFFLRVHGSLVNNMVVKAEPDQGTDAAVSIKWGSKLMKNVNNSAVNTKIMTGPEIAIFKQAAQGFFHAGAPQRDHLDGTVATWVKMPFVAGLSDADFLETVTEDGRKKLVTKIKQIRENIHKFSDEHFWQELGKIVAVDIFNGNNDRFSAPNGDWANYGNVMFVGGGVIGLDTYDKYGPAKNLNQKGTDDSLRILINPEARKQFAEACVKSVGKSMMVRLKSKNTDITLKTKFLALVVDGPDGRKIVELPIQELETLFLPYAVDLARGIELGAYRLKAYLQSKVIQYARPVQGRAWQRGGIDGPVPVQQVWQGAAPNVAPARSVPQGVRDRMAFLKW